MTERGTGVAERDSVTKERGTGVTEGDSAIEERARGHRKPNAMPVWNTVIWPDPPDRKRRGQNVSPALAMEPEESAAANTAAAEKEEAPAKRKRRKRGRSRKTGKRTDAWTDEGSVQPITTGLLVPVPAAVSSVDHSAAHAEISAARPAGRTSDPDLEAAEETAPRRKRRQRGRKRRKRADKTVVVLAEPQVNKRPPDKRIVPFKGPFKYDPSLLNDRGTGMIRLRGRRETGKRWSTDIPLEMAATMVREGAAGILSPGLIHKLYSKTDFRLLVLQRDNYVCRYCGRFGDTIDHVMPKSKGGLSSPANCVCACADCNLKKADSLDFVYDDF
ncbi:hypothetical protein GCM10010911_37000 [Paenibacillus nasutitermitis]|uniref:HNH nuclease domain-containing protein n=2 Tax=Paenibacillus nasutitermitis TaxID=1652958 RepID=A0A916Z478_9BACL|nr:hypothetical protein GCM10010911_37000 [Paenibacillus nasutitermitis]